jgi:hypothetical protein
LNVTGFELFYSNYHHINHILNDENLYSIQYVVVNRSRASSYDCEHLPTQWIVHSIALMSEIMPVMVLDFFRCLDLSNFILLFANKNNFIT